MADQLAVSIVTERPEEALHSLGESLGSFMRENTCEIDLRLMYWDELWGRLKQQAFRKEGPPVAEIGSTWLGSLVAMNAIRPFAPQEVVQLGGPDVFLPSLWNSTSIQGDAAVWAVPWLADTRQIIYWADLFDDAGIDTNVVFATPQGMVDAFEQLGMETPWAVDTTPRPNTLHNIASWVWGAGGRFVRQDGKGTQFTEPDTLESIIAYFDLHRFMPRDKHPLETGELVELFAERKVAAIMAGPWVRVMLRDYGINPRMLARVGAAMPPGPPFVGGSQWVIREHIPPRLEKQAVKLIAHLTATQAQSDFVLAAGYLPVRKDVLQQPPYTTDPYLKMFAKAVQIGLQFPPLRLWGVVETRLTGALGAIWKVIMESQEPDVQAIVRQYLEPLSRQLDRILAG